MITRAIDTSSEVTEGDGGLQFFPQNSPEHIIEETTFWALTRAPTFSPCFHLVRKVITNKNMGRV